MALGDWVDRFAVWDGFHPDLQTLLIYGAGIALYTTLVFAFYANISRRDPLHSGVGKGWWAKALHLAETALTFPVLSFGYFSVLALALFLMAKPDRETADILLLSMACVLGVRVTSHVSEHLSNDVAKLLPLGLLAVVIVDPGYLSIADTWQRVSETFFMAPVLAQYFALFIIVEAGLRAIRGLFPSVARVAHRVEHHRTLSKKAMLRDVAASHDHGLLHRPVHHAHAPRDRSGDFVALDENSMGKPGRRTGAGPGFKAEASKTHSAAPAHRSRPGAGPGGSGGDFGTF